MFCSRPVLIDSRWTTTRSPYRSQLIRPPINYVYRIKLEISRRCTFNRWSFVFRFHVAYLGVIEHLSDGGQWLVVRLVGVGQEHNRARLRHAVDRLKRKQPVIGQLPPFIDDPIDFAKSSLIVVRTTGYRYGKTVTTCRSNTTFLVRSPLPRHKHLRKTVKGRHNSKMHNNKLLVYWVLKTTVKTLKIKFTSWNFRVKLIKNRTER